MIIDIFVVSQCYIISIALCTPVFSHADFSKILFIFETAIPFLHKMKLGRHCYLVPDCLLKPAYLWETAEYLQGLPYVSATIILVLDIP